MNRLRITATAAVLAISLVACGGSDSDSSDADSSDASSSDTLSPEFVDAFGEGEVAELRALLASYGAPVDETKCVAEALVGNVDQAKLKAMLDAAGSGDAEATFDQATSDAFDAAVEECGLG